MPTPNYNAPTVGSTFSAGNINQFLGSHAATLLNQGTSKVSYIVAVTSQQNSNTGAAAQWIAQPFSTVGGQTTITRVELSLYGNTPGFDTTLELRTDNAGVPSNVVLWSCNIPADFQNNSAWATATGLSIPCNITGLSASTKYHLVIDGTSNTTQFARWSTAATSVNNGLKSASGSGSWTSVASTFLFNVFNGTGGVVRNIIEDCPAGGPPVRWVGMDYTNSTRDGYSTPTIVREVVGALRSLRTLSYSSGSLTGVA
jgi:hypothetical protein